jgi:DNA-binding NtrC family response regulator
MKGSKILIADDNRNVLSALTLLLSSEFELVKTMQHPNRLLEELAAREYDVVLLDMNFTAEKQTGNEGIFWLREIKSRFRMVEVVMFTAYGDVDLAVKALKDGAADFVLKPWDNEKLLATLRAAARISRSNRELSTLKTKEKGARLELNRVSEVIYRSGAMDRVMKLVEKVAPTDANILITGENGTGKELIAREIHNKSQRSGEYFVMADLSALTESLFESELFGYKKGAFTGADEDREGKFLLAHGGTLFLDEIGNIPLHLQSKLLTVLQTRTVSPVGSTQLIPLDIRLIAATNQSIESMVKSGKFREDLLYRINTITVHLPSLRERPGDIPLLANHFIEHYCRKYVKPAFQLDQDLAGRMQRMAWPGNVRELMHAIEKMVILSENGIPDPSTLPVEVRPSIPLPDESLTLEEMEERMIRAALARNGNNLSSTAAGLGISRPTLYSKMKKYGI